MTLFLDASVLVSMIQKEPDATEILARLTSQPNGFLYISPIVRMETSLAVARRFTEHNKITPTDLVEKTERIADQLISDLNAQEVAIDTTIGRYAIEAANRYGRFSRHPANLNMGDCYTYACAKHLGAKIAYKGNDFIHTDLGW